MSLPSLQVHAAIRENPTKDSKARSKPSDAKSWKPKKLSYDQRKSNLKVGLLVARIVCRHFPCDALSG